VSEGVVICASLADDPVVVRERDAVRDLDNLPRINADFSLSDVFTSAAVRQAVAALPYADPSSQVTGAYIENVRQWAPSFEFVVRHMSLPQGSSILDVGADLTWSTSRLARLGYRPIGIDINHHLPAAMALGRDSVPYAVMNVDMHEPAFAPRSFDAVTAFNALHHSARVPQLAVHLADLLRDGGCLGLIEPYWYYPDNLRTFGIEAIASGINENVYRLEEWHQAFVEAGLELEVFSAGRSYDAVYRKSGGRPRTLSSSAARDELFSTFYRSTFECAPP